MIAQFGTKAGRDRLGNLDRRKRDTALSERALGKGRNSDTPRRTMIEKRLNLPVPAHSLGETAPACAFAGAEDRSDQRKNAGWLCEQPARTVRQMLLVQLGQPAIEIIAYQRDRKIGRARYDANAELGQRSAKLSCTFDLDRLNAHAALAKIFLSGFRRKPEARPIGCGYSGVRARCGQYKIAVNEPR